MQDDSIFNNTESDTESNKQSDNEANKKELLQEIEKLKDLSYINNNLEILISKLLIEKNLYNNHELYKDFIKKNININSDSDSDIDELLTRNLCYNNELYPNTVPNKFNESNVNESKEFFKNFLINFQNSIPFIIILKNILQNLTEDTRVTSENTTDTNNNSLYTIINCRAMLIVIIKEIEKTLNNGNTVELKNNIVYIHIIKPLKEILLYDILNCTIEDENINFVIANNDISTINTFYENLKNILTKKLTREEQELEKKKEQLELEKKKIEEKQQQHIQQTQLVTTEPVKNVEVIINEINKEIKNKKVNKKNIKESIKKLFGNSDEEYKKILQELNIYENSKNYKEILIKQNKKLKNDYDKIKIDERNFITRDKINELLKEIIDQADMLCKIYKEEIITRYILSFYFINKSFDNTSDDTSDDTSDNTSNNFINEVSKFIKDMITIEENEREEEENEREEEENEREEEENEREKKEISTEYKTENTLNVNFDDYRDIFWNDDSLVINYGHEKYKKIEDFFKSFLKYNKKDYLNLPPDMSDEFLLIKTFFKN